jgi:CheY-like chemotaxis protein
MMSQFAAIPYFKFPVKATFLDDDDLFLNSVKKYIFTENKLISMETDANKVYKDFYKSSPVCLNPNNFIKNINLEEEDEECFRVNMINYHAVLNLIYNQNRFDEQAIFIVDYSMPIMNGLDFFKRIKHTQIKKIILTGHDDYKLAVDALNNNLIHNYMIKEVESIKLELNKTIDKMIFDYFFDFSNKIHPLDALHFNKEFVKIFNNWVCINKIVEFYQCDYIGTYFGLNINGECCWLVLNSTQQLDQFYDVAVNANADKDIIDFLRRREKIVFLFSEKEKQQPVSRWKKYTFPINGSFKINEDIFYYSDIVDQQFSLDMEKVITFKKFKSR